MEKEIKFFINIWNTKLYKVDEWNTHDKLIKHCLSEVRIKFRNTNEKKITSYLNLNSSKFEDQISSFPTFLKSLNYIYHSEHFSTSIKDRKYIFRGEKNLGNELVVERELVVGENSIISKKPSQKDLDTLVVKRLN